MQCVEDYAKIGLPTDVEALVLMETDGHPTVVEDEAAKMIELARQQVQDALRTLSAETGERDDRTRLRLLTYAATARALPVKHPAMETFWETSAQRAHAITFIARQLYGTPPDLAHTCGLFCDVGVPLPVAVPLAPVR